MNRSRSLLLSILVVTVFRTGFSHGAAGRPTEDHLPATLRESVAIAMRNRLETGIDREEVLKSESKVREAKGAFLPTLDISGSTYYINNYDKFAGVDVFTTIDGQTIPITVNKDVPRYQLDAALELNYNLYSGGKDKACLEGAAALLSAAEHQEAVTRRNIVLDVATTYWELRKAQAAVKIAERNHDLARAAYKVALTQRRAGMMSEIDEEAEALGLREKEIALAEAKINLSDCIFGHERALGLPDFRNSRPAESFPELTDDPDGKFFFDGTLTGDHEIRKLGAEITAAETRVSSAKAEKYPKLDLFARFATVGRDDRAYFDSWHDFKRDYFTVGIQLTANLFNGFRTRESIRQAASDAAIARMRLEMKKRELLEKAGSESARLEKAKNELVLLGQRLKLEQAKEKVAETRFRAGKSSHMEYRRQQTETREAADKLLMGRIDVEIARLAVLGTSFSGRDGTEQP